MSSHQELTYLRAAVQDSSPAGLVIILYDLLIGDLKRAITAMGDNDIEERSKALKHGFLVLQQLEGSLQMETGGEAAMNLARFYSVLRSNMMDAHIKSKPEILSLQIQLLLDVRGAWEQTDKNKKLVTEPKAEFVSQVANPAESREEQASPAMSWSA